MSNPNVDQVNNGDSVEDLNPVSKLLFRNNLINSKHKNDQLFIVKILSNIMFLLDSN